jgi:hypothetical protein
VPRTDRIRLEVGCLTSSMTRVRRIEKTFTDGDLEAAAGLPIPCARRASFGAEC